MAVGLVAVPRRPTAAQLQLAVQVDAASSSSGGAGTCRCRRFLRDYLYVPLGGNRKGPARRYVNLFLTMLLGGLWHGAAWTFVVWGALHGASSRSIISGIRQGAPRRCARPHRPRARLAADLPLRDDRLGGVPRREHARRDWASTKACSECTAHRWRRSPNSARCPIQKSQFFQTLLVGLFICLALPPTITLQRWVPQAQALAGVSRAARVFTAADGRFTVFLLGLCVSKLGSVQPLPLFPVLI